MMKEFLALLKKFSYYFALIESGNKMRTVSWLLLILSFALGIGCAFIVRHYMFEAKSLPITEQKICIKILVAKQTIPQGAEITAEAITFVEVPIAELPVAAITSFDQVYHRRSAYPISVGCPICEDLLLPQQEKDWQTDRFIPAGMQIVALEIEQVLLNGNAVEPSVPITNTITNTLSPEQRIDIRLFPKETSQGELVERKNQLLKTFMPKNEIVEKGELLLENIEILQIQNQLSSGKKRRQIPILTLVLEKEYVANLLAAARKGRIRVVPHRQTIPNETSSAQNNEIKNSDNTISDNTIIDEINNNITDNVNVTDDIKTDIKTTDNADVNVINITDNNKTETLDNATNNTTKNATDVVADIVDRTTDISLTEPTTDLTVPEITQHVPETPPPKHTSLLFIPPDTSAMETLEEIRDDIQPIAVAPLPGFYREKTGVFESGVHSHVKENSSRFLPHVIEIGLPAANETSEKIARKNYSPWGQASTLAKPKPETEIKKNTEIKNNEDEPNILVPPLRTRKKS
jgi:Flp pilus assembly protein CpaB